MGFCFTKDGKPVCDRCGSDHSVRRFHCPSNWCQVSALCPRCYKAMKSNGGWEKYHRHCSENANRARKSAEAERILFDAGQPIRTAALIQDTGAVRVCFKLKDQPDLYAEMSRETYRAYPLVEPVTLKDYQTVGAVVLLPETTSLYA